MLIPSDLPRAKKGLMYTTYFMKWMDRFIHKMEGHGLFQIARHLVVLDGHKSHINLDIRIKAKFHNIDIISISTLDVHKVIKAKNGIITSFWDFILLVFSISYEIHIKKSCSYNEYSM